MTSLATNAELIDGSGGRSRLSALIGPWFLPVVAAIAIFAVMVALRPTVGTPLGVSLVLGPLIPLVFAALAQMFIIAGGDIDLGIGSYIGLVNVVIAVVLPSDFALGLLFLVALLIAYAAMGVLIAVRRLPSIVVTLGMSFVWLGLALVILPTPGGAVPPEIAAFTRFSTPLIPGVLIILVVVTLVVALFVNRTRYGAVLRGMGSNAEGMRRAGWSVIGAKVTLYTLAGFFGILAGLFLSGQTGGGDARIGVSYVLLSIAAVIIGGGTFRGGEISVVGAVAGALVVGMLGALLQFLGVSSDFQVGVQGLLLVLVLVLRSVAGWIRAARRTR